MTFKSLSTCIDEALSDINNANSVWHAHLMNGDFIKRWNAFVAANVSRAASLVKTKEILDRRDGYWKKINKAKIDSDGPSALHYIAAYHISSWCVYDRLYDVYSRLAGNGTIAANEVSKGNVKFDNFFGDRKSATKMSLGSIEGRGELLLQNFRWSYLASYKIRNILVHDGGCHNDRDIFIYDGASDVIRMSDSIDLLLKYEEGVDEAREYSHLVCCSDSRLQSTDAQVVIEMFNQDMDNVIGFLIASAARDFRSQVEYVCNLTSPVAGGENSDHEINRAGN